MGVTGTESDSTLKMRLTPIFVLIILSCLLLNLTSAQHSASRKTSKNCRGPSSRPSSSRSSSSRSSSSRPSSSRGSTGGRGSVRCRPNVKPTTRTTSKATSTTTSNNLKPTRRTPKKQEEKPQELVPDQAQVLHPQKLQDHLESQGYPQEIKTKQNQNLRHVRFFCSSN